MSTSFQLMGQSKSFWKFHFGHKNDGKNTAKQLTPNRLKTRSTGKRLRRQTSPTTTYFTRASFVFGIIKKRRSGYRFCNEFESSLNVVKGVAKYVFFLYVKVGKLVLVGFACCLYSPASRQVSLFFV